MESGRDLGKVGTGAGLPTASSRGWLEGSGSQGGLSRYEDTAHGATLCCAASEPRVQRGLSALVLFSSSQHKPAYVHHRDAWLSVHGSSGINGLANWKHLHLHLQV